MVLTWYCGALYCNCICLSIIVLVMCCILIASFALVLCGVVFACDVLVLPGHGLSCIALSCCIVDVLRCVGIVLSSGCMVL